MSSLAISFLFITQRDSFIRDTIREFCRVNAILPSFFLFPFIIPEIGIVTSERFLFRLFKLRVISGPRTK